MTPVATKSKRILIVEDHPDCASVLRALLVRDGHSAEIACTVGEARQRAASAEFDVFLVDIILPDGTGMALAPELRQKHPNAKVVAVTALGQAKDVQGIAAAGFDGHVLKPYAIEDLDAYLE